MSGPSDPFAQVGMQFDPKLSLNPSLPGMGGQGLQIGGGHGLGLKADLVSPMFDGTNADEAIALGQVNGQKPMMGDKITDDQKKLMMLAGMGMMGQQQPQMPMQAPPVMPAQGGNLLGVIPGQGRQAQQINSALLGRYIK